MKTNIIAGNYCFSDELMFETNLAGISDADTVIEKIRVCHLYDLDYQGTEDPDTIELTLFFHIGILFDYLCPKSQSIKTDYKRIPCQKKLLLFKKQFPNFPDIKTKKYFVHNISNTLFNTWTQDGDDILTVTAKIEGIILTEYHHNFWICKELDLQPPSKPESYDWTHIMKNINIKDTVILFESLLTLMKGICSEKSDKASLLPELKEHKVLPPIRNIAPQKLDKNQCPDKLNNLVLKLKKELNEKDYIINGLLKYLNKPPSLHSNYNSFD
ncbi:MAG: hypothetical protein GX957_14900 [Clostridiaceae bacterium]|nr:hypothetical protein [Clostridiaceae bacterium]